MGTMRRILLRDVVYTTQRRWEGERMGVGTVALWELWWHWVVAPINESCPGNNKPEADLMYGAVREMLSQLLHPRQMTAPSQHPRPSARFGLTTLRPVSVSASIELPDRWPQSSARFGLTSLGLRIDRVSRQMTAPSHHPRPSARIGLTSFILSRTPYRWSLETQATILDPPPVSVVITQVLSRFRSWVITRNSYHSHAYVASLVPKQIW